MWDDHHTTHTVTCLFSIMTNVECPELANFPKPEDTVLVDSKFQVPSSKVCDCSRITSCVHTQPTATVMMMMRSLSGAAVAATACLAAVATAQQSCGRAPECRTVRPQLLAQHACAAFTLLVNAAQETCCSFVSRNSTRVMMLRLACQRPASVALTP
jgi:hypothetical protein